MQDFQTSVKDILMEIFDLKDIVNEFLVHYNERKHTTARSTPREIVEKSQDFLVIQRVKDNTNNSRRLKKYKDEINKVGLKVRISNYRN